MANVWLKRHWYKFLLFANNYINYFQFQQDQLDRYIPRCLIYALLWSFAGDGKLKIRSDLGDFIRGITTIPLPPSATSPIIDFEVRFITSHFSILIYFYTSAKTFYMCLLYWAKVLLPVFKCIWIKYVRGYSHC